jgi:Uma2 family endonuclease
MLDRMPTKAKAALADPSLIDQRVHLRGVSWSDYDRLLELRGDSPDLRLTYLDGDLEIMTPSDPHERQKKRLARLLEAWAEEAGIVIGALMVADTAQSQAVRDLRGAVRSRRTP